jgi:tRNA(Ile)-lysidine synthase
VTTQPSASQSATSPLDAQEAAALFRAVLPESGGGCLLAVSGGPDSVALMQLASIAAQDLPTTTFHVATVDHGLRPESRMEAAEVADQARTLGFAHRTLAWEGEKPDSGVQKAAREARYALLEDHAVASGSSTIMTAHTSDDQAETILMRLARGSGIDGIAGMQRIKPLGRVTLARPFLDIPKIRLIATCAQAGLSYTQDPSNQDERYARVRMRALLPLLESEGLTPQRLARLAQRARDASEALNICSERAFARALITQQVEQLEERERLLFCGAMLREEPYEILRRVVAHAIETLSGDEGNAAYGPRRERMDSLCRAVFEALRDERPLPARSLAGVDVAVDEPAIVTVRRSPPRRRG